MTPRTPVPRAAVPPQAIAAAEIELRRRRRERAALPYQQWLERVSPTMTWDWPHLALIAEHLDAVTRGDILRLMISCPPRHGKSEGVTIRFPVYQLERDPSRRYIVGAYNSVLAAQFSRRSLRIAQNIGIAIDRMMVNDWLTAQGGGLLAVGVGSGVTGRGAHGMLIDDPVKSREEAESQSYRDRVWDWYTNDMYTRLEPGAWIILIYTRWHQDDLGGRIQSSSQAKDWTIINLPALAETDDPLGRAPGQALCPERFDEIALEDIRATLGSHDFAALYQGRPQPAEGGLIKPGWFKFAPAAPEGLRWVRYYDLAASTKTTADYTFSCAHAMGPDGKRYFAAPFRGRWEWPDAKRRILQTMTDEPDTIHGIEEALHGLAALQELRRVREIAAVSLIGIKVDKDKVSRALPWVAAAEAGKVVLVGEHQEWSAFLDECESFPYGTHDDTIDGVSGCVQMLNAGGKLSAW